jgi:hypothetical protein
MNKGIFLSMDILTFPDSPGNSMSPSSKVPSIIISGSLMSNTKYLR